ncbi:MAG: Wzz/FepE/Etk N-terminal domain-containing protein, partial [Pseudomonadota bacterium]
MQTTPTAPDRRSIGDDRAYGDDETVVVDLRQVFGFFWRHIWMIGATSFVVTALAIAYILNVTPIYEASTEVVIEPRQQNLGEDFSGVLSSLAPDSAVIDTEVRVLRSRGIAERVIDRFDLMNDPEFNTELELPEADRPDPDIIRQHVVMEFQKRLFILREDLSFAIRIVFQSEDPRKAALLANAVAEAYLEDQLEVKASATDDANQWLEQRIATLREDVREAEKAVEDYRAKNGLINTDGLTLNDQKLAELNAMLATAQAEQAEKRGRLRRLKQIWERGGDVSSIPEALTSTVISGLRSQQAEVIRRRAELSSRYGARHPEMIEVNRELSDLEDQIGAEIERIAANLETESELAGERVSSLQSAMNRLESSAASDQQSLVRLRELEREAEASRTLFESFLARYKATSDQGDIQHADSRILSRAAAPVYPEYPKKTRFTILVFLGSIVLGIGLAALSELFYAGFSTDAQFERALGIPHLGYVPRLRLARGARGKNGRIAAPSFIVAKPQSPFAEAFGRMRLLMSATAKNKPPKRLLFASAAPDEGKTTIATSFARSMAMSGAPTILIDADLRRPSVHKYFRRRPKGGVIEYLEGDLSLEDVIGKDDVTPLHYLPVLRRPDDPRELLSSPAYAALIDKLSERYESVVFDTSPVLPVSDGIVLAKDIVDTTVLIVRWRKTPIKAAQAAMKELRAAQADVIGGVLSQV